MHMHWKVLFAHVHLWPPTAAVCESDHSAFPAHPPTTTGMIADLRAASVQRIDPTDGYAPKSCLPKCLTLSLVWKDRDPETFVFEYLASGAYRDAFESPAAKLLFKAHLPLGLDYQKVKGSETNEEEYALALKSDNHGLPIPHVHGLVEVRVQGWAGVVDYQLLFMERIDFTFAEWMRAHENTPPADGHLQRVVAMLIVTVRVMSRLVNPPYNYELADWHCGNFAFCEAANGALTFYLVDFQLNGAAEELRLDSTMSTGRRRMKAAHSALIASLKSADFLTVPGWKSWLSRFAGVLEDVWADTWHAGWGEVYGDAEFQRLRTTMEQSLPAAEVPAPHDPSMESSVDADARSPRQRTCSDAGQPWSSSTTKEGADAPVPPADPAPHYPSMEFSVDADAHSPRQRTCSDAPVPPADEKRLRSEVNAWRSPAGTASCASDLQSWPNTAGSVLPQLDPGDAAFPSGPVLSAAAREHLAWIRTAPWKHGRNHGKSSMPLADRWARDVWHQNRRGSHPLSVVGYTRGAVTPRPTAFPG